MRLTHHNLANMETIEDWNKCFAEYYQRKEHLKLGVMYKKLSDLEDIEDELGISLIDFFNLIKQGKFKYENEYGFIIDFNEYELKSAIKEILTKEELEK